jgi:hypothetical protein
LPVKDRSSKQQRHTLPREFLAQPTEFEKSEVLQQPLASGDDDSYARLAPCRQGTRIGESGDGHIPSRV